MYYNELGDEYLRQSEKITERIREIRIEAKSLKKWQQREAQKRILMLYDMAFEMKCIGNRLKGGYAIGNMLHK